jgi:hypothetical protein
LAELLAREEERLQCVVANDSPHPRAVPFGMAQRPALDDFADGIDMLSFLEKL